MNATREKTKAFLWGWSQTFGGDAIGLADLIDELELLKEEIDEQIEGIFEEHKEQKLCLSTW
jgi:hypothetical protein